MPVETLTPDTFDDFVTSAPLVLVEFHADWCVYCRLLTPKVNAIASDTHDAVQVGRLDVDAHRAVAERVGVDHLPFARLYRDGTCVEEWVGSRSYGTLTRAIEAHAPATASV